MDMKTIIATVLAAVLISTSAQAESGKVVPYAGNYKYERYHGNYDVNADGTHTETHDIIIGILTEEGVKSSNQANISYSESLEEAVLLSAYTLKKDGRRIDVPPANIKEREAYAGGGPMYSDIKTKVIIFPDVAAGDKVGYSYKIIQKQAYFPGHFSITQTYSKFIVYDDVRVKVTAPVNTLKLQVFSAGVQGGRTKDENGRMQWVWTYRNNEIATPEYGSVDPIDYGPRVIVSSFKDYGAVAAAYEKRARPKAVVTDRIRVLAEAITHGMKSQREQAKALYTWVSKNINYAGNCIGTGSIVPHDTDMILDNKLGDCKDHAVLLQALLAAKGIESTQVLINAGSSFKLPEVPSMHVLNHVINYIPSLDLYADATSKHIPFGLLPMHESGKPAVHTADFTGIHKTPSSNFKINTSTMKMIIHIHEDGSADGETVNEETGILSSGMKAYMAHVEPNMEDYIVRSIIARSGFTGTGTLIKGDFQDLSDRYIYGAKYHITNIANMPGPGGFLITPIFSHVLPLTYATAILSTPKQTIDSICFGGISSEEYVFVFPKNVKILTLPKDVHFDNGEERYDSTYRQEGKKITVVRKLEDRTPGPVCTPQDVNGFRLYAEKIFKDLRSQIIYQPASE